MTETTRSKSVKKPADHMPSAESKATFSFLGEEYTFDVRSFRDPRTLFAFKREDLETALVRLIGAEGLERAITSTEDDDGYADMERLAPIVEIMAEASNSKN